MADRAAIRDWVRQQTLIEEDDFSDIKVNAIIDQSINKVAVKFRWPWLAATSTLSVVASTSTYSLPSDHASTLAITRQSKAQRLLEVSPHEILMFRGGDLPSGTPTSYYTHGTSIYLDKVPTESITYDWLYYQTPSVLANDTDVPAFDAQFHLVLADFVIARVWEREEDFTKAESSDQAFLEGVEEMARFYLDSARDRPIIVGESRTRYGGGPRSNVPFLDGV